MKKIIENYDITDFSSTMNLSEDLARFIKENKLFHHIQGKAYVNVEGWQYAGARLGILPVVDDLSNISTIEGEIKYHAKTRLLNLKTQEMVGSGYAICSNRENGKRNYQEFAIASMAQTRSIGKAYRNILAWIIRAAGYEPTPAEEMDYMNNSNNSKKGDEGDTQNKNNKSAETGEAASDAQKAKLRIFLEDILITDAEREKMKAAIEGLTSQQITSKIEKVKNTIQQRRKEQQ